MLCVYALNDEVVTKLPALPLTSGILTLNCVPSPLLNVRFLFPLSNDAVVNPKLADVNKLAVAEFKLVIDAANALSTIVCDALNEFNASILICCDADD